MFMARVSLLLIVMARAGGFVLSPGTARHAQHARDIMRPPGTGTGEGASGLRMAIGPGAPGAVPRREAALWISAAALLWRPRRASADDEGSAAPRAEALFAAGDPRFLQAVFGERLNEGEWQRARGRVDESLSGIRVCRTVSLSQRPNAIAV
jgi:hypothetical protein